MFRETSDKQEVAISWRWFSSEGMTLNGIVIFSFAILLDIFFLIIFADAIVANRQFNLHIMLIFFILAALLANFSALIYMLNATKIVIRPNHLVVQHSPLPWLPAPKIEISHIISIEIIEELEWSYTESDGRKTLTFPVKIYKMAAIMHCNTRIVLFNGPRTRRQAEFLKEWVVHGINDQRERNRSG